MDAATVIGLVEAGLAAAVALGALVWVVVANVRDGLAERRRDRARDVSSPPREP